MVGERGRVGVLSHLFLQEIWFSLLFSHFPSCLILASLFLFNKQYFFRLSLTILLIAKSSIANAIINHSSFEFIILKYNAAVWRRRWHPTPVLFCLENSMDGGAWQAAVHGVAKSPTRLSDFMDWSLPGSSVHGTLQAKEYWSGVPLPSLEYVNK